MLVESFKRKNHFNGRTHTVPAYHRRDKNVKRSRKGEHIDMTEDISHQVAIAHAKIQRSKELINEAWDLINSVPKRVP
jgi:hypothetical protein